MRLIGLAVLSLSLLSSCADKPGDIALTIDATGPIAEIASFHITIQMGTEVATVDYPREPPVTVPPAVKLSLLFDVKHSGTALVQVVARDKAGQTLAEAPPASVGVKLGETTNVTVTLPGAPSVDMGEADMTAEDQGAAPSCTDGTANGEESDADCGGPLCPKCADGRMCKQATDCASGACTGGLCAAPTCTDVAANGKETDVDCGGPDCPKCGQGKKCAQASDCESSVCAMGQCSTAGCVDKAKNGDETDVDCGGSCPACADGKACKVAMDCTSGVCTGGKCAAPACDDKVKNGTETDQDCGSTCPACGDGQGCMQASDCASRVCANGKCAAASCTDGTKNGDETDVDCGGACSSKCADGKACAVAGDCTNGVCTAGLCQAAGCADGAKNGTETDVDCGGSCGACDDGKACAGATDCKSGVCTGGKCAVASCTDKVKNGSETDVDCGGSCTTKCGDGKACGVAADCASGVCTGGKCAVPSCTDKVKNGTEPDVDCGGPCTAKCADGQACAKGADCRSGACTGGKCAAPSCTDMVKNGAESDVDCGGGTCGTCEDGKACTSASDCTVADCIAGKCTGGMVFVRISPGTFLMGSPDSDPESIAQEKPQHMVTISQAYEMQTTEVTQKQWVALMGSTISNPRGDNLAVGNVKWFEVVAYCNVLSGRRGLERCYFQDAGGKVAYDATAAANGVMPFWPKGVACGGFRLPTEAEWEYACRAGTTTPRYGVLNQIAWYTGNAGGKAHDVGGLMPNAWGLYDLLGNSFEWCWDWWDVYSSSAQTDPTGPATQPPSQGMGRCLRGGGWNFDAGSARAAWRFNGPYYPSYFFFHIGFRPVRSLP